MNDDPRAEAADQAAHEALVEASARRAFEVLGGGDYLVQEWEDLIPVVRSVITDTEPIIRADERKRMAQKYGNGFLNLHRHCRCAQGGTYPGCPVHAEEDWEAWVRADEREKALRSIIDVPIGAHWQGVCGHHWDYRDHGETCPICALLADLRAKAGAWFHGAYETARERHANDPDHRHYWEGYRDALDRAEQDVLALFGEEKS